MRQLRLLADLHDGELIRAVIFLAIVTANTSHLDESGEGGRYAGLDSPPPDEVRRPISILALSQGLGLPFETTRRHVNVLLANGDCARLKAGVIVPQSALENEAMHTLKRTNLINVRRMFRDLKRAGLDLC